MLSELLVSLAGPIARQVMISLGVGVAVATGLSFSVGAALDAARSAWSGSMGADVAAYIAMTGINDGLSLIAGAISTRLAFVGTKSFRLL